TRQTCEKPVTGRDPADTADPFDLSMKCIHNYSRRIPDTAQVSNPVKCPSTGNIATSAMPDWNRFMKLPPNVAVWVGQAKKRTKERLKPFLCPRLLTKKGQQPFLLN